LIRCGVMKSAERLLKSGALILIAFNGALVGFFGKHLWSSTHSTVPTVFDLLSNADDSPVMCGVIDWLDKEFLLRKSVALAVMLFGGSLVFWMAAFLLGNQRGICH
jgi:hypothetical protein